MRGQCVNRLGIVVMTYDNGKVFKEMTSVDKIGSNYVGIASDYETTPSATFTLKLVAGSKDGTFAFQTSDQTYLSWASGNTLSTSEELNDASSWTLTYASNHWDIYNVGTTERKLQYNASSPRFACYGNSNQQPVDVWKQAAAGTIAKPTLTASQSFVGSLTVEMTATGEGLKIHYTTDGTDPTVESPVYSEALTITATTTVKAIAVSDTGAASDVASATYTLVTKGTIAEAATADAGTTCYVEGTVIATAAQGMLVKDDTGIIYYYNTAGVPAKRGDVVTILGEIGQYGGKNQFTNTATVEVVGRAALAAPAPVAMDGAALEAWATSETQPIQWATLKGTLAINNNRYYNITVIP